MKIKLLNKENLILITVILFGATSLFFSFFTWEFNATQSGLNTKNFSLFLYNFARLILVFTLGFISYSFGDFFLNLFKTSPYWILNRLNYFIGCILAGISLIGISMFILGFANLYYRALPIVFLVISIGYFLWSLKRGHQNKILSPSPPLLKNKEGKALASAAILLFGAAWLSLVLNKLIFIGEFDNDVWEHYLHYFTNVISTHGIKPNDIWIHYYVSKAAGLFFLAALFGDVFSIQAASMLAVSIMGLIVLSIIRSTEDFSIFSLCAAAILYASWNGVNGESGSLLKHHTIIGTLILGIIWSLINIYKNSNVNEQKFFLSIGILASFYLGLYITVLALMLCISALVSSVMMYGLVKKSFKYQYIGLIVIAGAVGACVSLGVNFYTTGLLIDTPINLMWGLVDLDKFQKIWSPLVIEYWFMGPSSSESSKSTFLDLIRISPSSIAHLLRIDYLLDLVVIIAFLALSIVATGLSKRIAFKFNINWIDKISLVFLMSWIVAAIFLSQLFKGSESLYRLYAFTIPIVISIIFTMYRLVLVNFSKINSIAKWLTVLAAYIICIGYFQRVTVDRWISVAQFSIGQSSIQEILLITEKKFQGRISVSDMVDFRKKVGYEHAVLFLTYDPSPAYFLPSPPIKSEPSYAFQRQYSEILFSDFSIAKKILQNQNIGFVAFNLKNRLFLGIPYSPLFSSEIIKNNFGLAWSKDDIYILGWKDWGVVEPIPEKFFQILEAKKTGIIPSNASELWGAGLTNKLRSAQLSYDQSSDYFEWLYTKVKENQR